MVDVQFFPPDFPLHYIFVTDDFHCTVVIDVLRVTQFKLKRVFRRLIQPPDKIPGLPPTGLVPQSAVEWSY